MEVQSILKTQVEGLVLPAVHKSVLWSLNQRKITVFMLEPELLSHKDFHAIKTLKVHTYIHTLLRLPSTGLFSHNVNYYITLVIKKRKENLFTVVQLNSKYIQNYSKYIQNYLVWNTLLKSLRLKLSISLVLLILSGSPFHSFGPRK